MGGERGWVGYGNLQTLFSTQKLDKINDFWQ